MTDIWTLKEEIIELFPEMEDTFYEADLVVDKPGCKNCKKNKQKRILHRALINEIQLHPTVDTVSISEILPETEALHQLPSSAHIERDDCIECVGKHLAQAYVLLKETQQGYPEHIEYASQHLNLAIEQAPEELLEVLARLLDILDEIAPEDKTIKHLQQALSLLEDTLDNLDAQIGLTRWVIIGHMAEAADECVGFSPEFANEIRDERLIFMDDPGYDIPLKYLLNKAKAVINEG